MIEESRSLNASQLVQIWIQDLVNAGMSHSRISSRLKLSPSTVQKIATQKRFPRLKTIFMIGAYYLKIFEYPHNYGHLVEMYYLANAERIKATICMTKVLLKDLEESCESTGR